MQKQTTQQPVIGLLAAHPEGLSARELRAGIRPKISQPTLSRRLMELRARGLVSVISSGRSTRYVFTGNRHRIAEMKSRALHERIAEKLVRNPTHITRALARVAELRQRHPEGRKYHDRWEQLLRGDRIELLQTMTADTEEARALRQETPFAGALNANERRRILHRFTAG
jgi:DNA-binding transcriptional ArsR family regulator